MAGKRKEYKRDKRSPVPKSEAVSRTMSQIKGKNTNLEVKFRKALFEKGVRGYRVNYSKIPGKPDVAFIGKKILVFVHGCFWHGCAVCGGRIPKHNSVYWAAKINKNIQRDQNRRKELESKGYFVIEIWEHEIKSDLDQALNKVTLVLDETKS